MDKKPQKTPKEKRRNMERRKEKSKEAARCRRSKEHEIFTDLCSTLPLSKADGVSHLDKASIVRIAISYLKIRSIIKSMPFSADDSKLSLKSDPADSLFLNALEGFLLVTTKDGDIVYISENVCRYLGLSQVDILGQSIYELCHPCEHGELKEMLSTKEPNSQKSHFLRMKCTLTNKGRSVNIKSALYKVIRFSGRMIECDSKFLPDEIKRENPDENEPPVKDSNSLDEHNDCPFHFVAVGEPISHPANIEIPLGRDTFLTKHSLDMKFTYADDKIKEFFGYDPKSLVKKSIFDFYHAEDSTSVMNSFKNLISKGQARTDCYRFLARSGGYAWVLTEATVIYNNSTNQPVSIVCVNFVIGEIERRDQVYSLCQLVDDGKPAKGKSNSGGASHSLAQQCSSDAAQRDAADGYLLEKSPQHLIEKLSIAPARCRPTAALVADDSAAFSLLAEPAAGSATAATSENDDYFGSRPPKAAPPSTATPALQQSSPASDFLLSDFFGDSVPADGLTSASSPATSASGSAVSPVASATSSTSSSPSYNPLPVDANWLINAPYDPSALPSRIVYQLPHSSSNRSPQQQQPQPVDGSVSSTSSSHELAEANAASNGEDSFQVTVGSTSAGDDASLEKTLFGSRSSSSVAETPKPSTINVFVPFTEDMDKGFLAFTSDETELTMLKEDPEDLTHLAPTAGDVCVPLDETPIDYVLPDMLDEMILLSDPNLLSSGSNTRGSPQPLSVSTSSSSPDSFFSCKDELEPSSRPHSPILTQNENCSLSSFGQDDDSPIHVNSVNHFLDFMSGTDELDDLSGKSSLMPLTLEPEPLFPLVTSNDFMWGSSSSDDSCAWSSVSNSPVSNSSPPSSSSSPCSLSPRLDRQSSSLVKLLTADTNSNYDGGGGDKDGELAFIGNRLGTKRNANGQISRRYQNINGGVGTEENVKGRQRCPTLAANPNRWTNRNQPTNLYSKSRSDTNYYGDGRKYRVNNNGGLQNAIGNLAKEPVSRLDERRKPQGGGNKSEMLVVGCKRGFGENWSRGCGGGEMNRGVANGNASKRSKQTSGARSQPKVNDSGGGCGDGGGDGRRIRGLDGGPSKSATAADEVAGRTVTNSVLMNLLVSGCDMSAGYNDDEYKDVDCDSPPKKKISGLLDPESQRIPSLMDLTEQDYAVNAPSAGELLQGSDLLRALECPGFLTLR